MSELIVSPVFIWIILCIHSYHECSLIFLICFIIIIIIITLRVIFFLCNWHPDALDWKGNLLLQDLITLAPISYMATSMLPRQDFALWNKTIGFTCFSIEQASSTPSAFYHCAILAPKENLIESQIYAILRPFYFLVQI